MLDDLLKEFLKELWMLGDVLLSALLGFIIGVERKHRNKEAGIRTHTIVCIGACLLTVVSRFGFGNDADTARVAAQIVSGVSFLGAGIIVYRNREVRGLTTAAGVWATAGIGMACGGRLYVVAVGAALMMIALQCFLHMDIRIFHLKKSCDVQVRFLQDGTNDQEVKDLFGVDRFKQLTIERQGDALLYTAILQTDRELSSLCLGEIMQACPYILSIDRGSHD